MTTTAMTESTPVHTLVCLTLTTSNDSSRVAQIHKFTVSRDSFSFYYHNQEPISLYSRIGSGISDMNTRGHVSTFSVIAVFPRQAVLCRLVNCQLVDVA